jgi:hypothetical protein
MTRNYGSYQCTKGEGAALNDINGTERDAYSVYRTGWTACHHGWYNGFEVPAAKRPATGGYPAKVSVTSPVLWRTVASNVSIAN